MNILALFGDGFYHRCHLSFGAHFYTNNVLYMKGIIPNFQPMRNKNRENTRQRKQLHAQDQASVSLPLKTTQHYSGRV